ncbi:hypothetical protein C1646_772659, partial [Rhizophagus diaphanus]
NERRKIPCIIITNVNNASSFSRNKWKNGINRYNALGQERIIFQGISGQIIQENFIYDRILKQQPYLYKSTYTKIHEMLPRNKHSFIDKVLSQFLKIGNYRPMTNRMQLCKNRLTTAKGNRIKIYIDGSVKFNKTENIEALFGLMIYDGNNKLLDTLMSTVKIWITVNKTEALAFLIALLVIPENKEATIFTDKLIYQQNLKVEVIKIKAHVEDLLHNNLDKEIKVRYDDIQNVNKLEVISTCAEYRYVLRWNGIIVETNIRRFIRLITRTTGLENSLI